MKRAVIALVVLAAAAVGAWLLLTRRRVEPGGFAGTIEARDAQVGSLVGGRVARVLVDEGAAVRRGDVLVVLESDLLDRQIEQEQGNVASQQANLEKVQRGPRSEEIRRARADWENAERNRKRSEALLHSGLASPQQYDADAAQATMLAETYRELARGSRPEDIAQARAQLAAEQGRLAFLSRQKEELTVRAPADGVIQTIDLRPGDLVAANQGIVTILEPSEVWVRVYVPEPMLGRVHVGDRARIFVDTFPGRAFPGRVVEIRQQAEYTPRNVQTLDQRADQVFGVKIAIDPSPDLKPGMAATARIGDVGGGSVAR
ncbi:MAG TPA: efflux RND transporter periplasmic adaptor subunit [Thermoanaerobaculia bacterium]|nr:efflux RND transporter periplasmic adaptor subunit [Thermoanaerobaculia bacterium]